MHDFEDALCEVLHQFYPNMDDFKICISKDCYNLIIESLEKQIPKKPQYVDIRFRNHGKNISDGKSLSKCYKCPNCNTHIFHVFDSEKFCENCGQALDWSNNNV